MITILIPGGFKPLHMGHLDMINKYASNPDVEKVILLVGPSVRDGLDQSQAIQIIELVLKGYPKVIVKAVNEISPVLAAYHFIDKAEKGTYAMGCSKKGEDYKRVNKFVNDYASKKYPLPEGVNVIEFPVDVKPAIYIDRTDGNNGKPISASILRQDVLNNDYENFYTNYATEQLTFNDEEVIGALFNLLTSCVTTFDKEIQN